MHTLDATDWFLPRHLGPSPDERDKMLEAIGASSLDALMDEAIPSSIRLSAPLNLPPPESEHQYLRRLTHLAHRNTPFRSYIGLGYHDTITPSVVLRMVMENPGWYTPYTPYQAEIAQGRLESLINFQTMVAELTGMDVANASLLDEATAAAEAMTLLHRVAMRKPAAGARSVFLVSDRCFPQTIDVLRSRAEPLDIDLQVGPIDRMSFEPGVYGALLQYPDEAGLLQDLKPFITRAHEAGVLVAVGSDLLALAIATPPGEMGADVVFGTSQRFGVPLGFGGPHAAFFATRNAFVRQMPGRIIGVSVDVDGRKAYRMALATREQHIRREKATSNICTAQALLANMAAMYAVYHGSEGLKAIASRVHVMAHILEGSLKLMGLEQRNAHFFDTLRIEVPSGVEAVQRKALVSAMNFRYPDDRTIDIALNETVTTSDVSDILDVFAAALGRQKPHTQFLDDTFPGDRSIEALVAGVAEWLPPPLRRTSRFLTHPVFNTHRSETEMMRYIRTLERKDLGLDTSMIPLGSCTMKLNAATEMLPVTWERFSRIHPFAPEEQVDGYLQMFRELEAALCEITGFTEVSLQPNSGAQGEFTGLMVIRAYHRDRGDADRDVVLIPASAHGTNPASAAMAGLRVVVVASAPNGNVDLADLRRKAAEHRDRLACLMITYPSTHGVFEDDIREICDIVHEHGGQVYMDGANMNAQVGLTSPASIGADVCHLNLHKTFAIPHGGGGPGMGPIGVTRHLAPYLPRHALASVGGERGIHAVSAAPWGSASILLISYAYIRMLGAEGLTDATRYAILNANYIKARLERHYPVLYTRPNGRVAHELIFDLRGFQSAGIEEMDVAKRLIDFGFHAPTVSFPVAGTLMVEPTESEDKAEIDRFCDAMIQIRAEIEAVATGQADVTDNVLKNAPHTAAAVTVKEWTHAYSREEAVFPLPFVRERKFWPVVGRIDNPYGDRNLFCSCPPMDTAG
ncbi:MAG TPA: aminomethyl-transferring glycine dehydrogenase [Vicinamibacterales bacterium]|nr:aminomethyl-transferring glycine dehydrogenase [Vicinamibacterales bacterium]